MAGSRIKGITVEIGGDCTALDKALKRVNSSNLSKPTKQMTEYMNKYSISLKTNEDGSVNLRETICIFRRQPAWESIPSTCPIS